MGEAKPGVKNSKTNRFLVLLVVSLLAFLASGYLWWNQVVNSPRNVFYGMLENSLSSAGVTKQAFQTSGAQTLEQTTFLQTGANKIAQSFTTLTQNDLDTTTVRTEGIGTPMTDYVRYTSIETAQTGATGEALDFSAVLGVWGRTADAGGVTVGELYGETVLGIVPFGYLRQPERHEVMTFIRQNNVYGVDYKGVEREVRHGRPIYVYRARVSPEHYVAMLKMFATGVGLTQLERFDPATFRDTPRFEFDLAVDIWSRQLVSIKYADSGRTETYLSHGARRDIALPQQYIPVAELQARLQAIQ